ncbi:hypothetical protein Sfulv_55820 [Streptomyces fulvorobeus]|uniref:Uncharacterized protein n=1 Tax=Streptomyces fulvorobeus TaxID=284028 RepID=A0A7J0CE26_9ACTN|nr:hypothetical protein [Streptomyces fulvorobeus]GFN00772.1 hypothetical protein Sfulv_55820 [Streptomyces fulvorobeus]
MALTWSKASWADKTYHARQADRSFTADHDGCAWRLRGWTDGQFTDYVPNLKTLRDAKQQAADRLQ